MRFDFPRAFTGIYAKTGNQETACGTPSRYVICLSDALTFSLFRLARLILQLWLCGPLKIPLK